jgi:hypothetical protein
MPFRFGVVTLTRAPQAFARARVRLADGRVGEGMAAELLAPKWFDKNPALSNEDNFEQLRAALGIARGLYLDDRDDTAFGRFVRHYPGAARARRRAWPERPRRALRPRPPRPRACSTASAARSACRSTKRCGRT